MKYSLTAEGEHYLMKLRSKKEKKHSKKVISSIIMYVSSVIVAIAGIASLINNILLFRSTVSSYVSQGYKRAVVVNHLIPSQLLPSIFEAVAFYGGIAVLLLAAGIINKKISKSLTLFSENNKKDMIVEEAVDETAFQPDTVEESTDITENIEFQN